MTPEKIKKTLEFHAEWLNDSQKGERANLTGADLTRANLTGANLTRADLYGANLTGANLYGANLTRADLTGANLTGADLYGANLTRADLTRANLTGANLTRANLYGADGIFQFGPMPTSGRIIYAVRHDNAVMINSGCFWGTVQELREKVKEDHNCPVYLAICDMLGNPSFKFNA